VKAVIFEVNDKKAVALTAADQFINVKNEGYTVGQEIMLPQKRTAANAERQITRTKNPVLRFAMAFAIIAVVVLSGVFGTQFYTQNYTAAYTLSITINPSITLYVNAKDIVYKIGETNADADGLNPNQWTGEKTADYIERYLAAAKGGGFLQGGATVALTFDYKKDNTDKAAVKKNAEHAVVKSLDELGITADITSDGEPVKTESYTTIIEFCETPVDGTLIIYHRKSAVIGAAKYPDVRPPAKDGFDFIGWSTQKGMTADKFNPASESYTVTPDMRLYAVWQKKPAPATTTVQFFIYDDDGISVKLYKSETALIGAAKYPDVPPPTKSGHTFMGWSTTKGMTADSFSIPREDYTVVEDMELYAVWKAG
jgi:uncharacterized repeat protein (TIGR02543 family)